MLEYLTFTEAFTCSEEYEHYPLLVREALRHPQKCCYYPDHSGGIYFYLFHGNIMWRRGYTHSLLPAPVKIRAITITDSGLLYAIGTEGSIFRYQAWDQKLDEYWRGLYGSQVGFRTVGTCLVVMDVNGFQRNIKEDSDLSTNLYSYY